MAYLEQFFKVGHLGVSSIQCPKDLIGAYAGKKCVVVSSGRGVWDDLYGLGILGGNHNNGFDVMCINDIVMHYPGVVEHLFSNDRRRFDGWVAMRREELKRLYGPPRNIHCIRQGAQYAWPWPGHGTSTLGGVYCCLAMGYDSIVLCGAPMDNSGHYFDAPWVQTNFGNEVRTKNGEVAYWKDARRAMRERVYSMSGRTRELLGAPPWLES